MYNYTSALFSSASHARAWESCDCERNVKEERVFHLDSFAVPGQSSGGFLSASFKFIGPNYLNESVSALRAAVQVSCRAACRNVSMPPFRMLETVCAARRLARHS
jgi:hypothetical protein